jgi:hypothetical protein
MQSDSQRTCRQSLVDKEIAQDSGTPRLRKTQTQGAVVETADRRQHKEKHSQKTCRQSLVDKETFQGSGTPRLRKNTGTRSCN